jgi:EAL domain-containing protein (putative c-di-GMP-specific phosphodiesterase class I)
MKTQALLSRKVQLAFVSAILALLVVGTISYRGRLVSAESSRWVLPTHQVLENLQELLSAMDSVESSYRGFALTGNEAYLESYAAGVVSAGRAESIAVNISAMGFRNDDFLEGVFAILRDTGLSPKSLELELTESVLMKRAESTESVLRKLRTGGVQLAVDDFGTGYSGLSYLKKFPIDSLKIDQSFIRQISATPNDTAIVAAVISMGRSLNLRVDAEGVETRQETEFLQLHQCDEAQGYYFSRPIVAQQFAKLLETGISLPNQIDRQF